MDQPVIDWREEADEISGLQDMANIGSNNYSKDASAVRNEFKEYFKNEGMVDWKIDMVTRLR